jgi:cytochrome c
MRDFLLPILFVLLHCPIASHAAAIHDAAMAGDIAAITAALDAGVSVDESDGSATPLYLAVFMGRVEAARLLIERGADVNARTALGSPLMAAIGKDKIDLLKLLLAGGADANAGGGGQPALHTAVNIGCLDCVQALVEAGADVNARAEDGKTPLHMATRSEQAEIAAYLASRGVVVPAPGPISTKLASADVEKGRAAFVDHRCDYCHGAEPQGKSKVIPNLWSVVGRDKASLATIRYSDALMGWEGAWTFEDLNRFLLEPMATTPGVAMETAGVADETERVNLIAYLRTLSDNPVPLP